MRGTRAQTFVILLNCNSKPGTRVDGNNLSVFFILRYL